MVVIKNEEENYQTSLYVLFLMPSLIKANLSSINIKHLVKKYQKKLYDTPLDYPICVSFSQVEDEH